MLPQATSARLQRTSSPFTLQISPFFPTATLRPILIGITPPHAHSPQSTIRNPQSSIGPPPLFRQKTRAPPIPPASGLQPPAPPCFVKNQRERGVPSRVADWDKAGGNSAPSHHDSTGGYVLSQAEPSRDPIRSTCPDACDRGRGIGGRSAPSVRPLCAG